jgi:hypothetical protein
MNDYVFAGELLQANDVGVALLFGVLKGIVEVDIGWLLLAFVVLFGVLDDAGGAERHEALFWVKEELLSMQKLVRNSVE